MDQTADILVLGGGAAGFFAAIHAKASKPGANVVILEKSNKVLAKVLISGGGRCNVTHNDTDNSSLIKNYPRGRALLKWPLRKWGVTNTIRWFERHGVMLKTEEDGRMFPESDSSESIAGALTDEVSRLGIPWHLRSGVSRIEQAESHFEVYLDNGNLWNARRVIVACGGFPKLESYAFLQNLGLEIVPPVPSLFTFDIKDPKLHELMGISTLGSRVKAEGMEAEDGQGWFEGPVLITHWGLSGPAVLKASAWLARGLYDKKYNFRLFTDWSGLGEEKARESLISLWLMNAAKQVGNVSPFGMASRLWGYLLQRAGVPADKLCRDLTKHERNKLVELCVRCPFDVRGKTTFKEEFVTAGGVASQEVEKDSMESKKVPGLFFAGEILDIDGITGGFNFQAAWSTGQMAGVSAAHSLR
ncbi:MAG: NAD(P)/FAD-dependent oxidoreductase [Bacteroidetes bacterium]|nr:NAD(P)/FAD-dependent oxidoreductase [Bacteroidota bacterium]